MEFISFYKPLHIYMAHKKGNPDKRPSHKTETPKGYSTEVTCMRNACVMQKTEEKLVPLDFGKKYYG